MTTITLIVDDGHLYTSEADCKDAETRRYFLRDGAAGIILIRRYDAGDCDTFSWPKSDYWTERDFVGGLTGALYDAREMGHIGSDVDRAILPDGTAVEF